jgi:O-antigen ligase
MIKGNLGIWIKNGELSYLSLSLIMVLLPLYNNYLPPVMIMLGLSWILENYNRFSKVFVLPYRYKLLFSSFMVFFLWQIVGIIYSSDVKMGLLNIFSRLSMLAFPLILIRPGEKIKANVFRLLRLFALATAMCMVVFYSYAAYRSFAFVDGMLLFNPHPDGLSWLNYFYGDDLTFTIHPSYISMFVMLSVLISFESFSDLSLKLVFRICWLFVGFFLLISIYFISSRAAMLAALVIIPIYALFKIITFKKSRLLWIMVVAILILSIPIILKNDRVKILLGGFQREQKLNLRNSDERIIIWESALKIAKNNLLFGVGIGDVRAELTSEYNRRGEKKFGGEKANAHNQFLEILLENGIIGLILFFTFIRYMVKISFSEKNLLYGLFILMMVIFFMFETILYRFAGVAFFSLFSFLLLHIHNKGTTN